MTQTSIGRQWLNHTQIHYSLLLRLLRLLLLLLLLPQSISIVESHQHHVCSELRLTRTEDVLLHAEVCVHLLQRLQTLGQVLIVDLRVKDGHVFLTQSL